MSVTDGGDRFRHLVERFGGELNSGTSPTGGNSVELRLPRYRHGS